MNAAVEELLVTLGPDRVKTGGDIPARNCADQARLKPQAPIALLLPRSAEEVATALSICNRHRQPVVTQGGLTGLAGGAHPSPDEVALSLERMVGVEEVDASSNTMTLLAGTTLQQAQQAAEQAGLMCGVDLGARGSCSIGGNVATNAGGNQVLRYGMTRKNVLGLEVALADGRIVRSLNKMLKNNSGYDWTQLFIGSEGTLGVVTRVVLQLHPRPDTIQTALLAVDNAAEAVSLLRALEKTLPGGLVVFEAMWKEFYEVATTIVGVSAPIGRGRDLYLLVEAPTGADGRESFEQALGALYARGLIKEAVVAHSGPERARLWALRESVYEHHRYFAHIRSFDISVPLNRMAEAIELFRREVPAIEPGPAWVPFGHIADSNLHINVMPKDYSPAIEKRIDETIYRCTRTLGGSISAEHGVGRIKRPYLAMSRTAPELELMATMKRALDPNGILNPGRIL